MNAELICKRCGCLGPEGARYCAYCGQPLIPPGMPVARRIDLWLDNVSPLQLALLVIIVLIPIGFLSQYLLVDTGLYFWPSRVLLALAVGIGGVCLGWLWRAPLSNRDRLIRAGLVLAVVGLSLLIIWPLDRTFLSAMADSDRTIVSSIPGVYLEASGGYKRRHVVSDPPPYWLITVVWALVSAVAGGTAYSALKARQIKG